MIDCSFELNNINDLADYQVVRFLLKGTKTVKVPETGLECYGKVKVW